jgi:hypothetical protein
MTFTIEVNMKISKEMLRSYIGNIMNSWIIEHGIPPETPDQYASYIEVLQKTVFELGDTDAFQLGVNYLIKHPEVDINFLNSSEYDWEDDESRSLLTYIKDKLCPSLDPKSDDVELVDMPILEWRSFKETL